MVPNQKLPAPMIKSPETESELKSQNQEPKRIQNPDDA